MPTHLSEILETAIQKLKKTSDSPVLDAEVILSSVLKKPKEFLYSHPENKLSKKARDEFRELLKQRAKGIPVAYLTAEKEFFGRKFYVNRSVLIPRPETEQLVELVLDRIKNYELKIKKKRAAPLIHDFRFMIHDLGTGSGCIAVTLAKELAGIKKTQIQASDISPAALQAAKKNAKAHEVKIKFVQSDLFENLNGKFDIIIANLPYVPIGDYKKLKAKLKFEPKIALTDGSNRFDIYKNFFRQLPGHIKPQAKIFLEIDPASKNRIIKWAKLHFPGVSIEFYRDVNKKIRYVMLAVPAPKLPGLKPGLISGPAGLGTEAPRLNRKTISAKGGRRRQATSALGRFDTSFSDWHNKCTLLSLKANHGPKKYHKRTGN